MRKYYSATIIALALTMGVSTQGALAVESEPLNVVEGFKHETVEYKKGAPEQLENIDLEVVSFIKSIANHAYVIGNKYGIYPSVTIAQAILESSVGKSGLAMSPNNNLFGVKGSYNGESVDLKTLEDNGSGAKYSITAEFKKYPSTLESIEDHGKLLREGLDGYYHGTWRENTQSYKDATEFLTGRYATDTSYSKKLNQLIEDYNLTRFDSQLDEEDIEWLESYSLDPWEKKEVVLHDLPRVGPMDIQIPGIIEPINFINEFSSDNQNKQYVLNKLGVKDLSEDLPRVKEIKEGYGVVYIYDNSKNIEERYGYVESVEKDSFVISEVDENEFGFQVTFKTVPKSDLYKYTFIPL